MFFNVIKYKSNGYSPSATRGITGHINAWDKNRLKKRSKNSLKLASYHHLCIEEIAKKNRNLNRFEKMSIYKKACEIVKQNKG